MPCCSVKLPFGEEIVGNYDADYEVDCEGVDPDVVGITCDGFWVGRVGEADRRYVPFLAKAAPEAALREAFENAARAVWSNRIADACQRAAEDNREINRFARG